MYQYLIQTFEKFSMKIHDKTPLLNQDRPREIKAWLDTHEHGNFIILDDDFLEEEYEKFGLSSNLIHTIYFTDNIYNGGLQDFHLEQIEKIFEKK